MANRREYWSWPELEQLWPEIGVAWDMSGLAGGGAPRIAPCNISHPQPTYHVEYRPVPVAKADDGRFHRFDDVINAWLHSSWEIVDLLVTQARTEIEVPLRDNVGLRIGAACYVLSDGTVTTERLGQFDTPLGVRIGYAVSPTRVLVYQGVDPWPDLLFVRELYPRNWEMEPTIVRHGPPHFTFCNTQRVSNGICDCREPPSRSKEVVRR
jgi:hypothetical protein